MGIEKKIKRVTPIPFLVDNMFYIIMVLMLVKTMLLVNKVPLEFDGSFNLQIPLNIVKGNGYTTFTGAFRQFNYQVTTGFPVLLPVAAVFKLFGIGVIQSRVVTIFFYFAFVYILYLISKEISNKWIAILSPVLFFLITDPTKTTVNAYQLIGEIPALFFLLLGFYFIHLFLMKQKNYILFSFLAGLSISFAYFSKNLFIFVIPSILVIFFYVIFLKKQKKHILSLTIIFMVMILSIFLWNRYIMNVIGDRYAEYDFWRRRFLIFGGSGVSEDGIIFSLTYLNDKMITIIENLGLRLRWICLITLGITGALLVRLYQNKISYLETLIVIFTSVYLFWWFGIANNIVFRHVLPAIIISFPLVSSVIIQVYNFLKPKFQIYVNYLLSIISILCVLYIFIFQRIPQYNDLSAQKEFASKLNSFTNQIVFEGWWQNPEISFLQQKGYMTIDEYKSSNITGDPIFIFSDTLKNSDYEIFGITEKCKENIIKVDDLEACFLENY